MLTRKPTHPPIHPLASSQKEGAKPTSQISHLPFGVGPIATALLTTLTALTPLAAQASADGYGLNSPSGETAIVGLDASNQQLGYFIYYTANFGQKLVGNMNLNVSSGNRMSGTFVDYSTDGRQGCRGRVTLLRTTARDARTPRYTLTFAVDGMSADKPCRATGQTFQIADMTWGKIQPVALEAARNLRAGNLVSTDRTGPINIRTHAGTQSAVRHIGYPGDRVSIQSAAMASDGYLWYQITFTESKAQGWVRGDFLRPDLPI